MTEKDQKRLFTLRSFLSSSYATLVSRLIFGGVFLVAGAAKIVDPGGLAASIRSYEIGLPEWFVTLSAYLLPYLEVMLGLYLVAGLFTKVSSWAANALMFVFIVALAQGAARGLEIDCGCFGTSSGTSSLWLDAARDLAFLALGLHIALSPTGRFSVDAMLRRSSRFEE